MVKENVIAAMKEDKFGTERLAKKSFIFTMTKKEGHAELVSAPHSLSKRAKQGGCLSCGVPK